MASNNSHAAGVPAHIRRLVTGHGPDQKGQVFTEGPPPRTDVFQHIPGMVARRVWATGPATRLPFAGREPTADVTNFVPAAGETRFIVATFPPDSVFGAKDFNPEAAVLENLAVNPGLAERFEPDGMHSTPTVDYAIVLDGELWLELDGGRSPLLRQHDVVIQNGTRHAWRNKTDRSATMAFILIGTGRD